MPQSRALLWDKAGTASVGWDFAEIIFLAALFFYPISLLA
jgi:hypothetical protein